jgi:hypothetical protein
MKFRDCVPIPFVAVDSSLGTHLRPLGVLPKTDDGEGIMGVTPGQLLFHKSETDGCLLMP